MPPEYRSEIEEMLETIPDNLADDGRPHNMTRADFTVLVRVMQIVVRTSPSLRQCPHGMTAEEVRDMRAVVDDWRVFKIGIRKAIISATVLAVVGLFGLGAAMYIISSPMYQAARQLAQMAQTYPPKP